MEAGTLFPVAILAALSGIAALRLSWARPRRSVALNTLGWGLLLGSILCGCLAYGAWGASVAALCAMGLAMLLLAAAAIMSPPSRQARSAERRVGMLPESGEPLGLGRRAVTFALTVIAAFAASVCAGLGLRQIWFTLGHNEANANVIALFAVPIVWTALAYLLLMARSRRSQLVMLLVAALPILPGAMLGGTP